MSRGRKSDLTRSKKATGPMRRCVASEQPRIHFVSPFVPGLCPVRGSEHARRTKPHFASDSDAVQDSEDGSNHPNKVFS